MRSWCSSTAALTASLAPPSEMRTQVFVDTVPCYFSGSLFCKKRIAQVGISVVLYVALSIYLSIYPPVYLCLSFYYLGLLAPSLPICLSIQPSACTSVTSLPLMPMHLSIHPSNCILPWMSFHLRTLHLELAKARATAKRFVHLGCISRQDVGLHLDRGGPDGALLCLHASSSYYWWGTF